MLWIVILTCLRFYSQGWGASAISEGCCKTDVFIAEQGSSLPGGHVGVYVSEPNMRRLKRFMEGHTPRPSGRCRDGSIVLPPTDLGCDPKAIDSSSRTLTRPRRWCRLKSKETQSDDLWFMSVWVKYVPEQCGSEPLQWPSSWHMRVVLPTMVRWPMQLKRITEPTVRLSPEICAYGGMLGRSHRTTVAEGKPGEVMKQCIIFWQTTMSHQNEKTNYKEV